jgi:hypothetical protein
MVLHAARWRGHMQFQKAEHSTGWCMKLWKNSSICVCWLCPEASMCVCVCVYIYKTGIFMLDYIFKLSSWPIDVRVHSVGNIAQGNWFSVKISYFLHFLCVHLQLCDCRFVPEKCSYFLLMPVYWQMTYNANYINHKFCVFIIIAVLVYFWIYCKLSWQTILFSGYSSLCLSVC